MRAKLLVTAVALGNLALGLSAGLVLGRRAAERQAPEPQLSQPIVATPAPSELSLPATPAQLTTRAETSPVSSRRGRRRHHRRGRRGRPDFMIRHLQQAVGMDEEQVKAAKAIMTRSHERVGALLEGVRPKMHEIQAETHAELRALLRPEQQKKLDALKAAMERRGPPWRWDKRRGKRGPEGSKGERWGRRDKGRWGSRGERGPGGERGERGPGGERGERGPGGERGERGPGGQRGERGFGGPRGPGGERGERGERGPRRERGFGGPRPAPEESPADTPEHDAPESPTPGGSL